VTTPSTRSTIFVHIQGEERGSFAVGKVAGLQNSYIEDLEDDHRRFAEALSDPAALESIALQAQLRDHHHHHIAIEEYDFFPAAASISPKNNGSPSVY
jgi:hypothetical protein